MGYMTELNTLIGLPKDFDTPTLKVGGLYSVTKERERSFPLHIAMLMVTPDWDFLGYAQAVSTENKDKNACLLSRSFPYSPLRSKNSTKISSSKLQKSLGK